MSKRALTWATAVWDQQPSKCVSFYGFVGKVKKVLDAQFSGREAAWKLIQIRQDSRSVADYSVDFCKLAEESFWNQEALFDMFLQEVKDELAGRELPTDCASLIAMTICIDGRFCSHVQ